MKKYIFRVFAVVVLAQLLAGCPAQMDTQRVGVVNISNSSAGFENCIVGEINAVIPTVSSAGGRTTIERSMYAVRCYNSTTTVDYPEGKTRKQVAVSDNMPVRETEAMVLPKEIPDLIPNAETQKSRLPEKSDKELFARQERYFKAIDELMKEKDRLVDEREKLGLNRK